MRLEDLRAWFSVSQVFVRKAILRGQEAEALAAYWGYTLKPLVELLRMRFWPVTLGLRLARSRPGSSAPCVRSTTKPHVCRRA